MPIARRIRSRERGHSPHGECGLKCFSCAKYSGSGASLPAWGVWIEIYQIRDRRSRSISSLPAWGVWIEIRAGNPYEPPRERHSPHGECGLKSVPGRQNRRPHTSLPAWGVWIEIYIRVTSGSYGGSHSPHGECGLKSLSSFRAPP